MSRAVRRQLARRAIHSRAMQLAIRAARVVNAHVLKKRLPAQVAPYAIERDYTNALLAITSKMQAAFRPLLNALPSLFPGPSPVHTDASESAQVRSLINKARSSIKSAIDTGGIDSLAARFADKTATYQKSQLSMQIRSALGADVFVADQSLKPIVTAFVRDNVDLIKDIGSQMADQIQDLTLDAIDKGTMHVDLAKQIQERFQVGDSRAKLIASDQIGKAYSYINTARQQELGVQEFVWRTVHDDRVRDEHAALDGQTFRYDDPPAEGMPGQAVRCRCYAEPVLDSIPALQEDQPSDA